MYPNCIRKSGVELYFHWYMTKPKSNKQTKPTKKGHTHFLKVQDEVFSCSRRSPHNLPFQIILKPSASICKLPARPDNWRLIAMLPTTPPLISNPLPAVFPAASSKKAARNSQLQTQEPGSSWRFRACPKPLATAQQGHCNALELWSQTH